MLYVKKSKEENRIIAYSYDIKNKKESRLRSIELEEVILEITEEQWIQSKYGKYADIVDNEFVILDNNDVEEDTNDLHDVRKYFILDPSKIINNIPSFANPYTAPCDGVVDATGWNSGGAFNLEIRLNGRVCFQNLSGGNYGDENEHKNTRVPVHKGDLIQMYCNQGSWFGSTFNFIPYKY